MLSFSVQFNHSSQGKSNSNQIKCQNCHVNQTQTATMAAALLTPTKFDKIIRNNVKFAKSIANSKSIILNKPYLNLICKQCAVTSHYRVCYLYINRVDYFHLFVIGIFGSFPSNTG